jgi:hypothetical protein
MLHMCVPGKAELMCLVCTLQKVSTQPKVAKGNNDIVPDQVQ